MIGAVLSTLAAGKDLDERQAAEAMEALLAGRLTPAQSGALLTAIRIKGETVTELAAAARALRALAKQRDDNDSITLELSGTGGSERRSFNPRPAAALVVAACGVTVARHGRQSATARTASSADVFAALGIRIDCAPDVASQCLREVGAAFLHAPGTQTVLEKLDWLRAELRFPTVLDLLAVLGNPSGARCLFVGVDEDAHVRTIAEVLGRLGVRRAWVAHGAHGVDGISAAGPTRVVSLRSGVVIESEITPDDFGLDAVDPIAVRGGDAHAHAALIREVLNGAHGAARTAVVLNAAAGLIVADATNDLPAAAQMAAAAIDSGRAKTTLERWVDLSHVSTA